MPLGKDIRSMYMYLFNKLPTRGRVVSLAIQGLGTRFAAHTFEIEAGSAEGSTNARKSFTLAVK